MFTNLLNKISDVIGNAVQSVVNATWKVIDALPWRKIDKALNVALDGVTVVFDHFGQIFVATILIIFLGQYLLYVVAFTAVMNLVLNVNANANRKMIKK